jgi:hypothetical protein
VQRTVDVHSTGLPRDLRPHDCDRGQASSSAWYLRPGRTRNTDNLISPCLPRATSGRLRSITISVPIILARQQTAIVVRSTERARQGVQPETSTGAHMGRMFLVIALTHVAADRHLSAWNFPLLLLVIGKSLVAENLRENQLARHRSPRSNRSRRQLGSAPLTREVRQEGKQRLRVRRTRNDLLKA